MTMRSGVAVEWQAALLLLLLLSPAAEGQQPQYVDLSFYLDSDVHYMELYHALHAVLADNEPRIEFENHNALAPSRGARKETRPARWLRLRLFGKDDDEATILLTDDDIYFVAFANSTRDWHVADTWDALFTEYVPPATSLPFNESYRALAGHGGHKELVNVPLGKQSALSAVRTLSGYNPATTPEPDVKLAMLKLAVMIPEALRFHPIRMAFALDWETETFLNARQADYTVNWGLLSYYLLKWNRDGVWPKSGVAGQGIAARRLRACSELLQILRSSNPAPQSPNPASRNENADLRPFGSALRLPVA